MTRRLSKDEVVKAAREVDYSGVSAGSEPHRVVSVPELKRTELPVGARVHHRGGQFSRGWTEAERRANPVSSWGTIVKVDPRVFPDGSREYLVRYDKPHYEGGPPEAWWASYHLDQWEVLT
jgi:hypothetical protein